VTVYWPQAVNWTVMVVIPLLRVTTALIVPASNFGATVQSAL